MTSPDSFLLLHVFLSISSLGSSLRLLELQVPPLVDVRERATLVCTFDLEGDHFFSLKWYKEELEFFRYMPDYLPRIQTFLVDSVNLVESESNVSTIMLSPLEYASSGTYKCEVSAGAPHFKVVFAEANMTVLGLPKENPKIAGLQESYIIGSYVTANCTSSPSYPAATMDWYINGAKAEQWFVDNYYIDQPQVELNMETRTIGLKFQTDSSHFRQRKDGTLSLVCAATVGERTRTSEMRAYLSAATREKYAQRFSNCCGNVMPTYHIIIIFIAIIFAQSIEYKFFKLFHIFLIGG